MAWCDGELSSARGVVKHFWISVREFHWFLWNTTAELSFSDKTLRERDFQILLLVLLLVLLLEYCFCARESHRAISSSDCHRFMIL